MSRPLAGLGMLWGLPSATTGMPESAVVSIAFGAYLLVLIAITWRSRGAATGPDGFVLGNRQVGLLGTMASQQVSITDGTGFIILVSLGASMGFGLLWFGVGTSVAYLLLAWQARRVRVFAEKANYVTVSDLIRDRVGPRAALTSAVVIVLTMFLSMGGSLHIAGQMFSELFQVHSALGVIVTALLIGGYLVVGGYLTVIRTDVLQWSVVMGLAALAWSVGDVPSAPAAMRQLVDISVSELVGLSTLFFFVNYAYVDTWQRIFSAKSASTARLGTLLTIPSRFFLYVGAILFGTMIRLRYPDTEPERFIYESFSNPGSMPLIATAIGLGLICLIMSTLDSRAYYVASTVGSNFLGIDPNRAPAMFQRVVRISVVLMLGALSFIAISLADVREVHDRRQFDVRGPRSGDLLRTYLCSAAARAVRRLDDRIAAGGHGSVRGDVRRRSVSALPDQSLANRHDQHSLLDRDQLRLLCAD